MKIELMEYDLLHHKSSAFISEESVSYGNKLEYSNFEKGLFLFKANCLEIMDKIALKHPEGCFDMVFADPPYFLSNGGITCKNGKIATVNKGDWDKSNGIKLNHKFNMEWLQRCQKLLKPNGTIWVSGTMHIIFSIGLCMQELGFKLLNDIAWEKPNPPPNLSCRYFTHSTETVIWASKNNQSKHIFNYEQMKIANGGKQMKSVWQIYPPKNEEKKFGKHPTQKPIELVERCILASTKPEDFILDPFSGSSTTGVASVLNSRSFCGIELNETYMDISVKRIKDVITRCKP